MWCAVICLEHLRTYNNNVEQLPHYRLGQLPNTAHSCSRHGVVTARLTKEWQDSIMTLSKMCVGSKFIACHCAHFWNRYKTHSSVCALLLLLPACLFTRSTNLKILWWLLQFTCQKYIPVTQTHTHLVSQTACLVWVTDPYFCLHEGVCWRSLLILVVAGYLHFAALFHMAELHILPPEVPGIHRSPCNRLQKTAVQFCVQVSKR